MNRILIMPVAIITRRPEPHILLFRRPLGTDPQTGRVDPELKRQALMEYKNQFGLKQNRQK
jgi:cyclin-dependent kinase regulatory subunit CKS1